MLVALLPLIIFVSADAEMLCSEVYSPFYKKAIDQQSVREQLSVGLELAHRYDQDPFVHNLAHDLLSSQGRVLDSGGIVLLRTHLIFKKSGVAELEIFHLRIPDLDVGRAPKSLAMNFAKISVALVMAVESIMQNGASVVELKMSTIINQRLRDHIIDRLEINPTFQITEQMVGYQIQVTLFRPENQIDGLY